jgi:hypothetical protein
MKIPHIGKMKPQEKPQHKKVSIKDFEEEYKAKNRTPIITL